MKILTAAQMREVDRKTIALGVPGLILMENAGHRVVEFLERCFSPLASHRILVLCGKGNNAGDGFVVARQLFTRIRPAALHVVCAAKEEELQGDAAANFRMLSVCGCPVHYDITPPMRAATIVVDALLGTGIQGAPRGLLADWIGEINSGFPAAKVVAIDMPSGLTSDASSSPGPFVKANYTVTFTAPKLGQVLEPNSEAVGELHVAAIGSPRSLLEEDAALTTAMNGPELFAELFAPRPVSAHKGDFGHVLVLAGSRGKPGAAAMTGMAALRAGAGLVTVASACSALPAIASHAPELMIEPLPETETGVILSSAWETSIRSLIEGKSVVAAGPGLGIHPEISALLDHVVAECALPMVLDADALNALGANAPVSRDDIIITPHPGEMSRLTGIATADIQVDRLAVARAFSKARGLTVVLKGRRTVIAFPDWQAFINPTGGPAMASGGSGDILTGLAAGLVAQFPRRYREAVLAAVWLHGRAGDLGARRFGEKSLIATDILQFLPEAVSCCASLANTF